MYYYNGKPASFEVTMLGSGDPSQASLEYKPNRFNPSAEYMVTGLGSITDGNVVPLESYTDEEGNTYPVTHINQEAFSGNSRVEHVEIPESVTAIDFAAFDSCENLSSLYFHPRCGAMLGQGCFFGCNSLEQVTVPALITDVRDSVFRECQGLKKVSLYGAVGSRMFYGCKNLKEVYIGDGVTDLPERAFSECSALDTVRMGSRVAHIGIQVFYNTSLKEVDFSAHTFVPTLENAYAFKGIERILVPPMLYEAWKAAPEWSRLAKRIVTSSFKYVSLGDSIAAGHAIDASWPGLETQYGAGSNTETQIIEWSYTDLIRKELTKQYQSVSVKSFARSGDKVKDLIEKLSHDVVKDAVSKADLVTICIGANDILGPALNFLEEYVNSGDLTPLEEKFETNLTALVDGEYSYTALLDELNEINPNAKYVFTTIYNPYKYLWLDESTKETEYTDGFLGPLLRAVPDSVGGVLRPKILETDTVVKLFDRVNRVGAWAEPYINRLNQILKDSVDGYNNVLVADVKRVFESVPDRPISEAQLHYNDLVNVEFTRGYDTDKMDWSQFWEGIDWSNAADNLDHIADRVMDRVVNEVILPDIDPHPETAGHYALQRAIADALGWRSLTRYTLSYDANGGSGSMTSQEVIGFDSTVFAFVKPNEFSPQSNFFFDGWEGALISNGSYYVWLTADTVLKARWNAYCTLTVRHTYDAPGYKPLTGGVDPNSDTGPAEYYEVWYKSQAIIGTNAGGPSLGTFASAPQTFVLKYGDRFGVVARTEKGSDRAYIDLNGIGVVGPTGDAGADFRIKGNVEIVFEWNYWLDNLRPQSYWTAQVNGPADLIIK